MNLSPRDQVPLILQIKVLRSLTVEHWCFCNSSQISGITKRWKCRLLSFNLLRSSTIIEFILSRPCLCTHSVQFLIPSNCLHPFNTTLSSAFIHFLRGFSSCSFIGKLNTFVFIHLSQSYRFPERHNRFSRNPVNFLDAPLNWWFHISIWLLKTELIKRSFDRALVGR